MSVSQLLSEVVFAAIPADDEFIDCDEVRKELEEVRGPTKAIDYGQSLHIYLSQIEVAKDVRPRSDWCLILLLSLLLFSSH